MEKTQIEKKLDESIKKIYKDKFIESLNDEYIIEKYDSFKSPKYDLSIGEYNYYRFIINKYKIGFLNLSEVKVIFCKTINNNVKPHLLFENVDLINGKYSYILKEYILYDKLLFNKNLNKKVNKLFKITEEMLFKENFNTYGIDLNLIERKEKLKKIKEKIRNDK